MQLYSAKIHLNGNRDNEVRKEALSTAEVHVLRALHKGAEHVTEIKPWQPPKDSVHERRSPETERAYLLGTYKPDVIARLFPNEFAELPATLNLEPEAKGPQPEIDINQVKRPKQASAALS